MFHLSLTKTITGEELEDHRQPNILIELNCDNYRKISVIFTYRAYVEVIYLVVKAKWYFLVFMRGSGLRGLFFELIVG